MSKKRAPRLPDRSPIACPDCSGQLHLQHKPASWGGGGDFVYLCENRPQCRGLLSAHPNGKPQGKAVSKAVRQARNPEARKALAHQHLAGLARIHDSDGRMAVGFLANGGRR